MKKKISAALIICAFVLLPLASRAAAPPDVLKRGRALFNRGLYIDAAKEFRKAVDADPKDVTARVDLGLAYYEAGKLGVALDTFDKVIKLAPNDRRGYNYIGLIYASMGLYDEAAGAFTRLTELDPKNADAYSNLGSAYYRKGDTVKSIEVFKKALSINPYSPIALRNLGVAYSAEGKWPEAIDALADARTVDAQYRHVEPALRDILGRALPYLESWARNYPDDPMAHYYLAYAAAFKGMSFTEADWRRAFEEIDKAAGLAPKSAKVCVARALMFAIQGSYPQAIISSKECVRLDPNDWEAWKGLAESELAMGNADDGLNAIDKAAAISPDIISVQENLGVAWSEKVDDKKALEHFLMAVNLGARSGLLEYDISVTYHNLKNFDMAWKHARRAQMLGYRDADKLIRSLGEISKEPED